ncbi:MAG: hypothetical protein WC782_13135 [Methylococcaceae bacterium]
MIFDDAYGYWGEKLISYKIAMACEIKLGSFEIAYGDIGVETFETEKMKF